MNGWNVVAILTLIEGLSSLGRTSALSPFLEGIGRDLSLSATQISLAYLWANILPGLFLSRIGKHYDQQRLSHFMIFFVALFGSTFIGMSQFAKIGWPSFINLLALLAGFSLIRISVHAYGLAERSSLAVWFQQKRGLATSWVALFLTFAMSATPLISYVVSQHYSWETAWLFFGFAWLLFVLPCIGLKRPKHIYHAPIFSEIAHQFRIQKCVLWLIVFTLFFRNFQITGIAFHLVPLCHAFNVDAKSVSACFIAISIIAVGITFLLANGFKWIGARTILLLFCFANGWMLYTIAHFDQAHMLWHFIGSTGLFWGTNNVIASMAIPHLFGVKNIGELHGFASSAMTIGSGLGPLYFGLMKDYASYPLALNGCLWMVVGLLLMLIYFLRFIKPVEPSEVDANVS